ncbi:hypothetical protein DSTSK_41600 [Desulforhabdus sp. TSK]|nr:hypothetical protein DSTSK_41600 [Desulforhabdus sp. TSK]
MPPCSPVSSWESSVFTLQEREDAVNRPAPSTQEAFARECLLRRTGSLSGPFRRRRSLHAATDDSEPLEITEEVIHQQPDEDAEKWKNQQMNKILETS